MSRWFRFYADAMRHPKVARLSDNDFRLWCELLSVAAERGGKIPPIDDLKHLLKRRLDHLSSALKRLISGGLIDPLEVGYEPHGWSERQYVSDTSTLRVRKYRKKRNVSVTPPDTEADTEYSISKDMGADAPQDADKIFWANAKAFIGGKNPGALIGKWNRDYGKAETAKAITAAQIERAVDPVSYIERCLRGQVKQADNYFARP